MLVILMENRMEIIRDIRRFNRYYTNILELLDRDVPDSGYSLTEARILYELHQAGRGVANMLSARLHIDKSYLSRILARFEKNGLIRREVSGEDSRAYAIELTEKGKASYRALNEKLDQQMHRLLRPLSDGECGTIRDAMEVVQRCFTKAETLYIRQFTQDDIAFVIAHQIELYETEYGFTTDSWKQYVANAVYDFQDRFDAAKDSMYILDYNGKPSGCIAVTHAEEDTAQLRFFFVDAAIRGMGIGKRLMELALAFCKEKQYRHIFLLTCSKLTAARRLYQQYGFAMAHAYENLEWGEAMTEERWEMDISGP